MKKKKTEYLKPIFEIDQPLLSRIAYNVWPKEKFNKLEGAQDCKHFYNLAYNKLLEELNGVLHKYHPASWIREAYIQLELWSIVLVNNEAGKKKLNIKGPAMFAPIGRYGWRYIIEISLERLSKNTIKNSQRPTPADIERVFTLLVGISYSSEYSNYLHYFKSQLSSANVRLSPYVFGSGLRFNEEDALFYDKVIKYMLEKPDWTKHKDFAIDNDTILMSAINQMLDKHFGFSLTEARELAEVFANRISPQIGASILITTYDEGINLLSEFYSKPRSKIKAILDFILLDIQSPTYNQRDFLSRSQHERMLNYSGAIIYLNDNFETIYDPSTAKFDFVIEAKRHIILTSTLMFEWLDVFVSRLAFGQRQDLKNLTPDLKLDISTIEALFHKALFEEKLKELITKRGFYCTSIKKINGVLIPCGEIDVVAYNPTTESLLIIEAKYHAPAKDARSMGKVISDHFTQKKYHSKFLSKITWVQENLPAINELFKKQFQTSISDSCKIEKYFVTGSSNMAKFLVKEYSVLAFYELDNLLNEKK